MTKLRSVMLSIRNQGVALDTIGPACAITSTESGTSWLSPIPITITFTDPTTGLPESVVGFVVGDITAVNCTLSGFANPSTGVYTVNATPTARAITIDVAAGVCTDAVGNNNTAATQFAITGFALPTDVSAADAQSLRSLFQLTTGSGWTNKTNWGNTLTAAGWFGLTVAGGRVTQINLNTNNLVGSVASWSMPTALTWLYLYANASVTGSISGWTLPSTLTRLHIYSTGVTGNFSSWTFPAGIQNLLMNTTSLSGDISGVVLPASLENLYINSTSLSGAPIFTSAVALRDFRYGACSLPQATVDLICQRIYARRASFTFAAPSANIGGSNAAPSGVYADEDPPVTGKGYIYELVNDPEAEGFRKWLFTYTA